jgi:hypothetical protein
MHGSLNNLSPQEPPPTEVVAGVWQALTGEQAVPEGEHANFAAVSASRAKEVSDV